MRARHLSPSIHAARKPLKRFLPVIRSVMLDWLCTRMARPPIMGVPARNTAARSASPEPVFVPAATKTGITARKNWGCTKYKTVPNDYRLSIDRSCLCFKRTYALRTECERYNSRFKASGQERLWVRNGNSAANLNTLAHISALAVALAAVLHGSHSYRSAKQLRRSA